ncbi:MAG: hypothetical protein COS88_00770 [Chloroflexi bacterium CG07_land_8_20_14_0_80_51_10]|nr:MAG: hypothetical protein COS88_00770 [Chloroflexi bacterium CG07_land_8_20_14_0_80_51_10]
MAGKTKSYSDLVLGVSMAATWTYAVSVVVGMAYLHHRLYVLAMTAYLFPVVWVNLQGMYEMTLKTGLNQSLVLWGVIGLGLLIMGLIGIGGLRWSILSDQGQWALLMLGVPAALVWTLLAPAREAQNLFLGLGNVPFWGLWGATVLLASPFISAMQIERAKEATNMKPFWIAGGVFAVYLGLLGVTGAAALNPVSTALLAVIVLMASTSTLDSAASGLQYTARRKMGIILGLIAVATWPLVVKLGVLNLWAAYGSALVGVVIILFIVTLWWEVVKRR